MITLPTSISILAEIESTTISGGSLRKFVMERLSQLPNYHWTGDYCLEGDELVLDEYVGDHTDHTRIAVGQGVCGTAVAENANQVIVDVRELTNYLSCSAKTRSEIVVLIKDGQRILGQIDVDGHEVGAFDRTDEEFLEKIAALLAQRWQ